MRSAVFSAFGVLAACSTSAPATKPAAAAPVAAATAPQAANSAKPQEVKPAAADPDKLICKRITVVGSNYPKKFCSTQAEWEAQKKASLEQAEQVEASRNRADASTVGRAR